MVVASSVPAQSRLLSVRKVEQLWVAEFEHGGESLCGIYREVCRETFDRRAAARLDPDLTVRSRSWSNAYETLEFAWDLTTEQIEEITKLELAELPVEQLAVLVQIALHPKAYWSAAARAVEVSS